MVRMDMSTEEPPAPRAADEYLSVEDRAVTNSAAAVSTLDASRVLHADARVICATLASPDWLGRMVDAPANRPYLRRIETDLAFTLQSDGRLLTFRKAALVDIGPVSATDGGCGVEIGWQAASFAPLFPVFAGRIIADGSRLDLHGVYAPPGGGIGLLIDHAFLHYFARRTANWFLDRLAHAVVDSARRSGSDR